nr:kunitz-type elastase inhibitor BrEI-like [Ipomoea trifida]
MKIVFFLLLSICALPLTISAPSPFIRLPTDPGSPVIDSLGNPVVGGDKYYARVISLGVEGGISAANYSNPASCPTDVFLNLTKIVFPPQPPATLRPIIFHPPNDPTGVVYESDPIYVQFDPVNFCPTAWKLDDQKNIVTLTYPQPTTFQISVKDSPKSYIFVGIGVVDELNRLGITDTHIYGFEFVRV